MVCCFFLGGGWNTQKAKAKLRVQNFTHRAKIKTDINFGGRKKGLRAKKRYC